MGDLLEGHTGQKSNLEQEYQEVVAQSGNISPMAVQSDNSCNTHSTSCGHGRENGFSSTFLSTGCRQWEGWSYGNYGAVNIPFWIDMPSMNTITNVTHRNILINDLRTQAALWNDAVMHDGTGQIVNLYEVGIGSNTRPGNINGKRVVEVMRKDGDYAGQFKPPTWLFSPSIEVRINYDASGTGTRPGRNVDTPVHEFGHLLGLNDLDTDGTVSGTHKVLMGYARGTNESTLINAIKYQDIQGIAVLNDRHTSHQWTRYAIDGSNYLHFCFYCDTVDSVKSAKTGSSPMLNTSTCLHNYQPMVSHRDRHWLKCTACYKVIESDFTFEAVSGTPTTLRITGLINNNLNSITIPNSIDGLTVTHIAPLAFNNKRHLTQVTVPSTVTHIESDAFKNTNNASIYLMGRTTAPSTFDIYWNSSNNPVYLNSVRCTHSTKTLININSSQHVEVCNTCRSTTNIVNHSYGNTWLNYRQHRSFCSCGLSALSGHVVSSGDNGYPYKTCLECGGPAEYGFVVDNLSPTIQTLSSIYISEHFGNDSYILSNGVIVLSDIDLEKYFEGTLVLPNVYQAHNHDCVGCLSECTDCDAHCHESLTHPDISKDLYISINKEDYLDFKTN